MALTTVSPALLDTQAQYTGFKNRIINGDMRIDQRNAGAVVTQTTTSLYTVDRWAVYGSANSKLTLQQNSGSITPPTGFKNYLGIVSSSAYAITSTDEFEIYQGIEGYNTGDLGWGTSTAQTITLSFVVRSSLTGTFGGAIQSANALRSYAFSYSIPVANIWTTISITIAGDTLGTWNSTNGTGLALYFGLGQGSTRSIAAGSWVSGNYNNVTGAVSVVGTAGATFQITGVQLEKGSTATSFDYRDYGRELIMCQRYYEVSYARVVDGVDFASWMFTGTSNNQYKWSFSVVKRAVPTFALALGVSWVSTVPSVSSSTTAIWFNSVAFFYLSGVPGVSASASAEL